MTAPSPAEELRAAAGALRAREDAAWNFMGGSRRTFEGAVAALLEQTAEVHRPYVTTRPDQCRKCFVLMPCPDVAAALAVARTIPGGETP
jgi:hypothetical protein